MKNIFITTENVNKCTEVCQELESPESLIGPSLAMFTGPAGRGKSEFAKYYATNSTAIYIPPLNVRSPAMVLREIAFELSMLRPRQTEACMNIIGSEMAKARRLIFIDEADLLPIGILEMLRNINERYACPVVLIGEEELKGKVGSRRRITSRIRRRVEFNPVTQPDMVLFYAKALDMNLSNNVSTILYRGCGGDWRPIEVTAIAIERALRASGVDEITEDLAKAVVGSQ